LRPAAFFWAVVPPCEELLRLEPEWDFFPPRPDAPGELAIFAARSFDMPFSFSASYCFSFFTLGRLSGIGFLLGWLSVPHAFPGRSNGNAVSHPMARGSGASVRLRYVDQGGPGLTRRRRGRGFEYLDPGGQRVDDETAERIRRLTIPPAWTDVWICPWPNGHLQATGRDTAGRLQYLYHSEWRTERDREKFERMLEFAGGLPALREQVSTDLAGRGLRRERVLACATRLLDRGFFRIGGESYAEENGTFGLATLQRRHVRFLADGSMLFAYAAKGGRQRRLRLADDDVRAVLRAIKRRHGPAGLLAYRDGRWIDVRSGDINEYIREYSGGPFSAKDFRTWHATVLAAVAVAVLGHRVRSDTGRRRVVLQASREVARYLGNTPAVCRDAYIDPRVFERYYADRTIAVDLDGIAERDAWPEDRLRAAEASTFELL
jgi:DNA topoisomerase I